MRNFTFFLLLVILNACKNNKTGNNTSDSISNGNKIIYSTPSNTVSNRYKETSLEGLSVDEDMEDDELSFDEYDEDEEMSDGEIESTDEEIEENKIKDDTYSATVEYNNPNTGYSATYTLDVEVEDNEVTVIHFPNDGYLDEDHIAPAELDEDGHVEIEGEDGKTYDIQIDL